jgi:hypothetical protein
MASGDPSGAGAEPRARHGSPGPAEPERGPQPPLVLEMTICEADPLAGTVGPANGTGRVPFRGWIDLMSAIGTLCADHADGRPGTG